MPSGSLQAQLIVDESWAIALRRRGGFDLRVLLGAGGLLYLAWIGGTVVGVLLGNAIGDANRLGLDAAFPALFLALLVPQLTGRRRLAAALLGGGIALVLIPFTPAGVPIVAGAAACLVGGGRVSAVWLSVVVVGARDDRVQGDRPGAARPRRELPAWLAGPVSLPRAGRARRARRHADRRRRPRDRRRRATRGPRRRRARSRSSPLRAPLLARGVMSPARAPGARRSRLVSPGGCGQGAAQPMPSEMIPRPTRPCVNRRLGEDLHAVLVAEEPLEVDEDARAHGGDLLEAVEVEDRDP